MAAGGKKRVVFTWELGEGMGHMVPYIPLVTCLQAMGCEVMFVVKDLSRVEELLGSRRVGCVQAPGSTHPNTERIRVPCTYTHILHNNGFSDHESLTGMVKKWRELFETLKPSLVIFDHSPTALLASRGYEFMKVHMGTGFTVPPDLYPLPNLRTWLTVKPGRLQREEDYVLGAMNRALAGLNTPPLRRIADLFSQDPRVLMTCKELDPYGERPHETYWGTWLTPMGEDPLWPDGPGKRVFAYLKPFPGLASVLSMLNVLKTPVLAYIPGVAQRMREEYASPTLRFVHEPLNMGKVARQCDLAVLNGTHFTTAQFLFAGKPTFHFPLYLEQYLTAHKIEELGAGLYVSNSGEMEKKMHVLLNSAAYGEAARNFSIRYEAKNQGDLPKSLVSFIEDMGVSQSGKTRKPVPPLML